MAKFEDKLDARISEVLNEAKLNDDLYQRYVQYVGALDALPQDQIATDKYGTDIHDQFGRIKPLSQWPTKTTRARSEKVWLNYNQRMQLQAAAKDAGLESDEPEPTEDPNFLSQMLDTCVRTSMSMGGLDRNTAFRHCSRQVDRFERAIQGALADKGLPKKELEEFISDLLKGMANGKQINIDDLSVEDRQFIQDLKDSLAYTKRDTGIKEDLDDADEFTEDCNFCSGIFAYSPELTPEDQMDFHAAHVEWLRGPEGRSFLDVMEKHGFTHAGHGEYGSAYHYARKPVVKEDLDDTDEFGKDCTYFNCDNREDRDRFHRAHTTAYEATKKRPAVGKFSDALQNEMAKFGYYLVATGRPVRGGYPFDTRDWSLEHSWMKEDVDTARPTPTIILPNMKTLAKGDWIELGPPAKLPESGEGLDDQDEFGRDQDWPVTPVQIVDISDVSEQYKRHGPVKAPIYRVRLNNFNLLSQPDKSGVRWHGRPKHHEPTWYQPWHGSYADYDLEYAYNYGELRIIDNIEQWYQSQPEK